MRREYYSYGDGKCGIGTIMYFLCLLVVCVIFIGMMVKPASAATRIEVRTIADTWCVEVILAQKGQPARNGGAGGGIVRSVVDPVIWLTDYTSGSGSQYILGV